MSLEVSSRAERSWQPTASIAVLERRARLLARLRGFFAARGILEVETPVLCGAAATDPHMPGLKTRLAIDGGRTAFLHSSPEFAMKRLLAAAGIPWRYELTQGSGDLCSDSLHVVARVYVLTSRRRAGN